MISWNCPGYSPRKEISGSCGHSTTNILKKYPSEFENFYEILCPHQPGMNFSFSMRGLSFLILAMGVKWFYSSWFLSFISLLNNDVSPKLMCSLDIYRLSCKNVYSNAFTVLIWAVTMIMIIMLSFNCMTPN